MGRETGRPIAVAQSVGERMECTCSAYRLPSGIIYLADSTQNSAWRRVEYHVSLGWICCTHCWSWRKLHWASSDRLNRRWWNSFHHSGTSDVQCYLCSVKASARTPTIIARLPGRLHSSTFFGRIVDFDYLPINFSPFHVRQVLSYICCVFLYCLNKIYGSPQAPRTSCRHHDIPENIPENLDRSS